MVARTWLVVVGAGMVLIGLASFLTSTGVALSILVMVVGVLVLFWWALAGRTVGESNTSETLGDPGRSYARPLTRGVAQLWAQDPKGMAIDLLRVGVGFVWVLNLIFVVDPTNQFFGTFQDVALSFAPTSLGGPGVANFVAANAPTFAWLIAILTAYLAIAFVFGVTTRLACIVGGTASVGFLLTQFLSTFQTPGGTDVGPHPLYLLIYLVLFAGAAGRYFAVDHWIWLTGHAKFPRLSRWLAAPRQ